MSVKLLIDSSSDISKEEAKELGVDMISMMVSFGEEEYLDGEELLPTQFYEKLTGGEVMPKTSQISPYRFEEVFEELTKNGDEVVVITISSKLSGTVNSARQAAEKFNGKVKVIDSLNAATGERILLLYALEQVKQGKTASEIEEILNEAKGKIKLVAMIDTLKYLRKGGRISATAAFAGELLNIKPIVSVADGEVKVIGKAMGSKKGMMFINNYIKDNAIDFDMPYGLIWSGLDNSILRKYKAESASVLGESADKIPEYILGGTIGTHIGPGAIGIAYFEK